MYCCVCGNSFCKHCGEIRRRRGNKGTENTTYLNEFLEMDHSPSTERNLKPQSFCKIPFFPNDRMKRNLSAPPSSYLPVADSLCICQDELRCCAEMTGISARCVKLFTKNTYYECIGNTDHKIWVKFNFTNLTKFDLFVILIQIRWNTII